MNYAVLARHHDMMRLLATEKERRSREEILEEVEISPQLVVATSGEHHTNVSIHWAPVEPVYESLHTYFPPDNAYESCSHCAAQVGELLSTSTQSAFTLAWRTYLMVSQKTFGSNGSAAR